jgi:PTH1 family peptidyl-tRNA hydrolase
MADIFDLFRKIEKGGAAKSAPVSWLIVGLGNPGDNYRYTRHNAGFMTVDALAESLGVRLDRMKFHALTAEAQIGDCRVLLMKPTTFMNNSGIAVAEAASFYKIASDHILVISDDISLAPGKMRVRAKGSAGGHNGLKSIIEHLSTEEFPRLRMGVGAKPHPDYDLADWVLANFPKDDLTRINEAAKCAQDGIRKLLNGDLDSAVQICNSHKPSGT